MSLFYPDLFVDKITDINLKVLCKLNIKNILLDIDDTVSPNNAVNISKDIIQWICMLKENSNKIVIVSNNSKERVEYFAKKLDVPYIYKATKPLPFGINKAMKIISAKKNNTALIGDQIFTDVLGAKFCSIKSILIEPLNKNSGFFLKFKRSIEAKIKNNIKCKY